MAPENLTATANGLGSLQISWSLNNADNVSVDFVLTATNVADSSETIVMRMSQLNSVIPFSDTTSCNTYSIQVVANNSAGQGPPSDIIIRSVPSLPEISAVEESLQHTLRRTSSGVTLDVTFDVRRESGASSGADPRGGGGAPPLSAPPTSNVYSN